MVSVGWTSRPPGLIQSMPEIHTCPSAAFQRANNGGRTTHIFIAGPWKTRVLLHPGVISAALVGAGL